MAESSFSSNESSSFIHISHDNRIHLWDTDTRKERRTYVEKQHLSHTYTCSSWRAGKKDNLGYFALGTSDGTIIIWDLTRGVVSKTLGKANESPVPTSVVFSNDSKSLLVSSSQNHIVQYNLSSGEEIHTFKAGKKGVLKVAVNPKVDVVAAAGSSVRIIDVESGRKRKLEAQFSGGIVALSFTQCGRYLAVAGSGSREVLLFDVQAGAKAEPLVAIAVLGEPKSFSVRSVSVGDEEIIEIICIFEDQDVCFIRYTIGEAEQEGISSICNISTTSDVMAACFGAPGGKEKGTVTLENGITLAIGSKTSPSFINVTVEDVDRNLLDSVEVGGKVKSSSAELKEDKDNSAGDGDGRQAGPVILGPHESVGVKRPLLSSVEGEDGIISAVEKKKKAKKGEESEELTLEQRLESLSASLIEVEKGSHLDVVPKNEGEEGPSSNSLVVLIDQALQSGDDALLEQSLACEDASIVDATARRLAPGRIVQLLRKLVAKFEKRPSRGLLLTRWLASVMRFHTSFLISVPDLSSQLSGLSQMLEQRLSSYTKLAALGGRLDLLMSQISSSNQSASESGNELSNGNHKKSEQNEKSSATPRRVYKEV